MFRYDSSEIPACERDAQKQNLQRKYLKTSFKTPETLGKVKEYSMGHSRGFYTKKSEKSDLCAANKYMPVSHSTGNSQSLNDSSRAPCSPEKSEDVSRGWHA